MANLEQELEAFGYKLDWFKENRRMPREWFSSPQGAVVLAEDMADFERLVKKPEKLRVVRNLETEERFNVVAKLAGSFSVGRVAQVSWIEIVEPSPEEQEVGISGFRHLKFFYPQISAARYILRLRDIPNDIIEFSDHAELNVLFDDEPNSFRLINRPIEEITDRRVRSGDAQELPVAA